MQVRIFHIRLTKEKLQPDQDKLNEFMENVQVKQVATEFVNGQVNFWSVLIFYESQKKESVLDSIDELTEEEKFIYEILKTWRYDKSKEEGIIPFMICSNKELVRIIKGKPQVVKDLLLIKGFANRKVAKYGEEIIAVLNSI